jgi:hypothetical protein
VSPCLSVKKHDPELLRESAHLLGTLGQRCVKQIRPENSLVFDRLLTVYDQILTSWKTGLTDPKSMWEITRDFRSEKTTVEKYTESLKVGALKMLPYPQAMFCYEATDQKAVQKIDELTEKAFFLLLNQLSSAPKIKLEETEPERLAWLCFSQMAFPGFYFSDIIDSWAQGQNQPSWDALRSKLPTDLVAKLPKISAQISSITTECSFHDYLILVSIQKLEEQWGFTPSDSVKEHLKELFKDESTRREVLGLLKEVKKSETKRVASIHRQRFRYFAQAKHALNENPSFLCDLIFGAPPNCPYQARLNQSLWDLYKELFKYIEPDPYAWPLLSLLSASYGRHHDMIKTYVELSKNPAFKLTFKMIYDFCNFNHSSTTMLDLCVLRLHKTYTGIFAASKKEIKDAQRLFIDPPILMTLSFEAEYYIRMIKNFEGDIIAQIQETLMARFPANFQKPNLSP